MTRREREREREGYEERGKNVTKCNLKTYKNRSAFLLPQKSDLKRERERERERESSLMK